MNFEQILSHCVWGSLLTKYKDSCLRRRQPFEPPPGVSEMNPWTNDMAENELITLQCTGS